MKRYLFLIALIISALNLAAQSSDTDKVKSHFAWGASTGASVDMSGHDMSAIDIDLVAGYRGGWVKFAGVGVGAEMMISNGSRAFPLYGELRTNFMRRPSLLFWDLKVGVSLNYLEDYDQKPGEYISTGVGFKLARGERYSAHMLLAYTFHRAAPYDLHAVGLTIGVVFH